MSREWKLEDKVQWTSQSAGSHKLKKGTVVALIPANRRATAFIPGYDVGKVSQSQRKFDTLYAEHDRYLIAVPRGGKSVLVDYYCPHPNLLQPAE